jgi:hypothetical protein
MTFLHDARLRLLVLRLRAQGVLTVQMEHGFLARSARGEPVEPLLRELRALERRSKFAVVRSQSR